MHGTVTREQLDKHLRAQRDLERRDTKRLQSQRGYYDAEGVRQGGLIAFVRYFWHVLEPATTFVDGWPLWALAEHLEACSFGEIKRLLCNVPPGFAKSLMTNVFFPAWEWGPRGMPHLRYISFSYSATLTERDNDRFRTLISSPEYQGLYGPIKVKTEFGERVDGVGLRNKTTIKVMNTKTGWKFASSCGGVGTGERSDRILVDDAHNVSEAESEVIRKETARWFRESVSSRFNNLDEGVLIVIGQRVHEDDISGLILGPDFNYTHLMIPWEFDPDRVTDEAGKPIPNDIGWVDPRCDEDNPEANDGEPAWLARYSEQAIARTKREIGEFGWASQYQQSPLPRGGGLFKRSAWRTWAPADGVYPLFDYVIASLDAAITIKDENNPSGFTVWGVFRLPDVETGETGVMLVDAWRKRLPLHGTDTGGRTKVETLQPGDTFQQVINREFQHMRRVGHLWGLVEWLAFSCKIRNVDLLLIESEKGGIAAAQEMQRLHANEKWSVQLQPVQGDKYARALGVQPQFAQGKVWAPIKDWAEMVIEEMEVFPHGKYKDLTDSTTQALKYIRDVGLSVTETERIVAETMRSRHKSQPKRLYPV